MSISNMLHYKVIHFSELGNLDESLKIKKKHIHKIQISLPCTVFDSYVNVSIFVVFSVNLPAEFYSVTLIETLFQNITLIKL